MFDARLLAFCAVAALLTITPGADTMLVVRSVLSYGRRAGILTICGICLGCLIHATLSACGLSLILVRSAEAFAIVKLLGAGYLVFLGIQTLWRTWMVRQHVASIEEFMNSSETRGDRESFFAGLGTNLLNPKVAVFYLAFLPQFIGPSDPVIAKSLLMAVIHNLMGFVWLGMITFSVAWARDVLTRPRVKRWIDTITGLALVGLGLRLAAERRS